MFTESEIHIEFCLSSGKHIHRLIPNFYIAKLGYAGVYLFFLFLLQNIDCGFSLEPTIYVLSKNKNMKKKKKKKKKNSTENFHFLQL